MSWIYLKGKYAPIYKIVLNIFELCCFDKMSINTFYSHFIFQKNFERSRASFERILGKVSGLRSGSNRTLIGSWNRRAGKKLQTLLTVYLLL